MEFTIKSQSCISVAISSHHVLFIILFISLCFNIYDCLLLLLHIFPPFFRCDFLFFYLCFSLIFHSPNISIIYLFFLLFFVCLIYFLPLCFSFIFCLIPFSCPTLVYFFCRAFPTISLLLLSVAAFCTPPTLPLSPFPID